MYKKVVFVIQVYNAIQYMIIRRFSASNLSPFYDGLNGSLFISILTVNSEIRNWEK